MSDEAPVLVAVEGDPASPIWVVQNGFKRHIADWETFQSLGYDIAALVRWPLLQVAQMPNGSPLALGLESLHE